jgi:hypothetical protein
MNRPLPSVLFSSVLACLLACLAPASISLAQQVLPASSITRAPQADSHPLDPALEMVRESLSHMQSNVQDYTALFAKRCRVDGELAAMTFARVKIRNPRPAGASPKTPMSVYLDFVKPSSVRGREVIWVDGRNEGKLIAHETGMANFVSLRLDPNGYLAMRGQRRPITEIGIENLLKKIIERGELDRQYGECDVKFFRNAKLGDMQCTMLQVTHPLRRPYFDFYQARIYFSESLKLPVRYESWSWPATSGGDPVLEEEYNYLKVKVNVGLTDLDFDPENRAYRFP